VFCALGNICGSVSQPVVRGPPGVRGRFRRGTLGDIKSLKLWLFYSLSLITFEVVDCISDYCLCTVRNKICSLCDTVITEFVFCLLLR
jgi:hypothetical protein